MHEVFIFGKDTSTTTLRAHLVANHLGLWVESCDNFKIPITAESARGPVDHYRASKDGAAGLSSISISGERPSNIPEFSYEAFVDAVTQFIVADDQVSHFTKLTALLKLLTNSNISH